MERDVPWITSNNKQYEFKLRNAIIEGMMKKFESHVVFPVVKEQMSV